MQFSKLFDDDRAVSPVIGVILMVAITVILAAVIGTFVLGLSDQVQETTPNAQIAISFDQGTTTVDIVHESGEELEGANLAIKETAEDTGAGETDLTVASGTYAAGDYLVSGGTYDPGETIRVVWSSPNSDSSSVLAKKTAP